MKSSPSNPPEGLSAPAFRFHHVGIIVPDEQQATFLRDLFGWENVRETYVDEYQAKCVFCGNGKGRIELVVPKGGKLADFNKGRGGIHHIALEVNDLTETRQWFAERDIDFLEDQPVQAGPLLIDFIPPVFTRGLIVELIQSNG